MEQKIPVSWPKYIFSEKSQLNSKYSQDDLDWFKKFVSFVIFVFVTKNILEKIFFWPFDFVISAQSGILA